MEKVSAKISRSTWCNHAHHWSLWYGRRLFRRMLPVSRRLYRRSFWTAPSLPDLHYARLARLRRLPLQHFVACFICRSRTGDGVAKHGVSCNLRGHRRLAASRTSRNGLHAAIDIETCAYRDRADRGRNSDRLHGFGEGRTRWSPDYTHPGSSHAGTRTQDQNS